jgi:predicted aspartyl protease
MKIEVLQNQAPISLLVKNNSHDFSELEFIIDTGFTGTIFFFGKSIMGPF